MSEPTAARRRNPKAIGETSEAIARARLVELGYAVSVPFGNNQRYDLIVDEGGVLTRAQVKTGRLRSGRITFPTVSTNGFTGEQRGYQGEADIFIIYCPETNETYRVPVAECGVQKSTHLRVDPQSCGGKGRRSRRAHECVLNRPDRWSHLTPLKACRTVHPDTPSRIAEKATSEGTRRYCKECNRTWARQAFDRRTESSSEA